MAALRAYAPNDRSLYHLGQTLAAVQRRNFYQLQATCRHRGHYYHEYCMAVDVERDGAEMTADAEDAVREALRDLARWLYARLESDYAFINSDEAIDEAIIANDYRFTEDGAVFG